MTINETHDPQLRSWLASAQTPGCDFPLQNLPFAVFRRREAAGANAWRGGVAIGDAIVDLAALAASGLLTGLAQDAALAGAGPKLNPLMAMGQAAWQALRLALSRGLRDGVGAAVQAQWQACLVPQSEAEYDVPAHIGDYTDFYTSIYHATNIGRLFRPDNPLLPNYQWVPIGYHGRASSVVISGQAFARPNGQTLPAGASTPVMGPSQRLDIELELGIYVGPSNPLGQAVPIGEAESHVFGVGLLNDWSARDLQAWEYQPLGPFLAKSFASTVSPWIVTLEALAPYRAPLARPSGEPAPLPYLSDANNLAAGAFDIQLAVDLQTPSMRRAGTAPSRICLTSYRHAYWTLAQLIAHHTVNGCNLQSGDLLGSGTLSGPTLDQAGALIELTQGGKNPLTLPGGETRTFLEDGDSVTLRGWCERSGFARIGFGTCEGSVLPAHACA